MKRFHVPFLFRPGDDLDIRPQLAAVDREVDVHVVFMGRDDDGGRVHETGLLHGLYIRRVAQYVVLLIPDPVGLLLDDPVVQPSLHERAPRGPSHASSADDDDGRIGYVVDGEQLIVGRDLAFRPQEHQDHPFGQRRIGRDHVEPPPLPHADDRDAGQFAKTRLAQGLADERGVHDARVGDHQVFDVAEYVGHGIHARSEPGEELPHLLSQLDHVGAARQLEDIHGVWRIRRRQDGDILVDIPDRKGDAGIQRVLAGGHDERRLVHVRVAVGLGIVQVAVNDVETPVVKKQRFVQIGYDEYVVVSVLLEPGGKRTRHLVVMGDDHVILVCRIQSSGRARDGVGAEPGPVDELDKGHGKHDDQRRQARQQHAQ